MDTLNGMNLAKEDCDSALTTESLTKLRFSAMSEHSSVKGTPEAIREWLTRSQQDSHVNRSAMPDCNRAKTIPATCGRKLSSAFASYDQHSGSWKTSQVCLLTSTFDGYSETWPKQGMMQNGVAFPLKIKVRRLKGSGYLLPSPTRAQATRGWGISRTGRSRYGKARINNALSFGYKPHPEILEWSMGWPITWTELRPLEMDKYRQWYEQHWKF